ncbi:MAG: BlaI/MecI/CopY family transcriptional regulator [Bacteroidetes Order II. Incertae sedis bacterium]|nr:BlaI/MecI/CopY family transcriptional regulator [Bacteroidetes Order II. bacterium]
MTNEALSRRERQIMDILFRMKEASAEEIREAMEDAPSNASVRTLLRILAEKQHIQYRTVGNKYLYSPATPTNEAGKSALKRVLNTFFGGSATQAVATMLSRKEISEQELDELQTMINKAREEGR